MFIPPIMLCIYLEFSDVNQHSPYFEIRKLESDRIWKSENGSDIEPSTLFTLLLECEHLDPNHSELYFIGLRLILTLFLSHCMSNSHEHLMKKRV